MSIDQIVTDLSNLKVSELLSLKTRLETEWGVSADNLQVVRTVDEQPTQEAEPEQTEFTVVMTSFGDRKIEVIKVVRELTSLGLKEAKALVEDIPAHICEDVAKDKAQAAVDKLQAVGATVGIQ